MSFLADITDRAGDALPERRFSCLNGLDFIYETADVFLIEPIVELLS